jgi:glutathione synthase/RimK-type ligase-like ATP-grasp enzyme
MRIALVTCRRLPDLDPDDRPLADTLAARGHQVTNAIWDDPAIDWASFEIAMLRSPWDYHLRRAEFLAWAERTAAATRLLNPLDLVRWNSHKSYLLGLAERGAAVIPTAIVAAGSAVDVRATMAAHGWARAVLKPAVSADAWRTILVDEGTMADGQAHADALLAERDLMVQPYFASVEEPGERCLVHVDGRFSHAVRKRSHFLGGRHAGPEGLAVEAAADERDAAGQVLSLAGAEKALYARVDLARDADGRPCLMELELVEPTLFFAVAPEAAERMVDALEARAAREGEDADR